MPALLINGADAQTTYGFVLTEAPSWIDLPSRSTPTQPVIGKQGSIVTAAPIENPRRVTLRGFVTSSSVAQTRTNIDNLKLALVAPLVQLIFQDSSTRHVTVGLDSFTVAWSGPVFIERRLRVEVQMTAYDPFFYDNTQTTVNSPTANNLGGFIVPGTGIVRPVITLTGAVVNPLFTLFDKNGVSFATLGLTLTDIGGDTLVVDCDARTIKKNGSSVLSSLTSGDFFVIDPSDTRWQGGGGWINANAGVISYSFFKSWR